VLSVNAGQFVTALGRGNGTFTVTDQIAGVDSEFLAADCVDLIATGDFNSDGNIDAALITPGTCDVTPSTNSMLSIYKGNGHGIFQPVVTGIDLQASGTINTVVGDFNGDGNLDVVIAHSNDTTDLRGLIFLAGKGDGTFAAPALLEPQSTFPFIQGQSLQPTLLSADLNRDGKLDLIWENAAYLGKGDGTFQQVSTVLAGAPSALADLNGDNIADVVIGSSVYAGNGDGTFQSSPFYTATLPQSSAVITAAVGDLNADGRPDLLVQYQIPSLFTAVSVFLGDGKGNFTADNNTYYSGIVSFGYYRTELVPARLNNQALTDSGNRGLDLLTNTNYGATSLLNQTNPAPTGLSLLPSQTMLSASATTVNENQKLNFTATVTGINPTGNVTFTTGNTMLGTSPVTDGVATLPFQFTSAGTFPVTANYTGDALNAPSLSNAVSITIAAPDFTVSASPATATIAAGQSSVTTLTITPIAGYSGTVKFSCGTLSSETTCSFAPSSVTTANGTAPTTMLTISTTAPSSAMLNNFAGAASGIAWAGIAFLTLSPRRLWKANRRLTGSIVLMLLVTTGLVTLFGCSSSSPPKNPGTPAGGQTITISAADSAAGPTHSITFQLTVQ
jgi:Bacterial Ig-like domain (group 3)/FG-GAP-like repeat